MITANNAWSIRRRRSSRLGKNDPVRNFGIRNSAAFKDAVAAIGARQLFIKPHCPWQNGKIERLNRTLQTEWAYRQHYASNDERTAALAPWLDYYNNERQHHGIGGQTPISRITS